MDLKTIHITASPKQLMRLRKGHKIRVRPAEHEEEGTGLVVFPEKYELMTRTFARGRGLEINLDPHEIIENRKYSEHVDKVRGLFGKNKKTFSPATGRKPKMEGEGIVEDLTEKYLQHPAILSGKAMVTNAGGPKNPLMPTTIPSMIEYADRLNKYNKNFGTNLGYMTMSGIHNALADLDQNKFAHDIMHSRIRGTGRREVSSVSHKGTLLSRDESMLPPALRSQPFSANFHFQTQFPPAYQKFEQGPAI